MVFCSALFTSSACSLFFLSSFSINARLVVYVHSQERLHLPNEHASLLARILTHYICIHSHVHNFRIFYTFSTKFQDTYWISGHFRIAFKVSRISEISKQLGDEIPARFIWVDCDATFWAPVRSMCWNCSVLIREMRCLDCPYSLLFFFVLGWGQPSARNDQKLLFIRVRVTVEYGKIKVKRREKCSIEIISQRI